MDDSRKIKIAIVLSGCGFKDGSEIHESVMTMLAIDKNGAEYKCFAPDIDQVIVVNHFNGQKTTKKRNLLTESARIARSEISSLSRFKADDFDALIFPGGFGAISSLCTFAEEGVKCRVNADVAEAVNQMFYNKKPIGALCIAPVILARLIKGAELTIGDSTEIAKKIELMGAVHIESNPTEVIVDKKNRIATTPCYMYKSTISEIAEAAEKLVKEILKMLK